MHGGKQAAAADPVTGPGPASPQQTPEQACAAEANSHGSNQGTHKTVRSSTAVRSKSKIATLFESVEGYLPACPRRFRPLINAR